jgi:hypothetical protein
LTVIEYVNVIARTERLPMVEIFDVDVAISIHLDASTVRLVELIVFTDLLTCKLNDAVIALHRPH